MKTFLLLLAAILPAAATYAQEPAGSSKEIRQLLQQGLFEEEANRDLDKAAAAYSALVQKYDEQRAWAATALFRLAEVRAKQGDKAGAIELHQRLLREFSDQDSVAARSRERLASLGGEAHGGAANAYTARLQEQLAELRIELASRSQNLTAKHPKVIELQEKIATIEALLKPGSPLAPTQEEAEELARVQEMAKNSPDLLNAVSRTDGEFTTPLGQAAERGHLKVAEFLIQNGGKVNGAGNARPPLWFAASKGHKAIVELLLKHQADANQRHQTTGETALTAAAGAGRTEVVRVLLNHKADPNIEGNGGRTALYAACVFTSVEIARMLLEAGANPDTPLLKNEGLQGVVRQVRETPLHRAVAVNNIELAALLLDRGANPNGVGGDNQETPLTVAIHRRSEPLVRLLLAKGADVNLVNSSGHAPPLHAAAAMRSVAMARLLIAQGAKGEARDANGQTPLHASIGHSRPLPAGGDDSDPPPDAAAVRAMTELWQELAVPPELINAKDKYGQTPLHYAIAHGMAREAIVWLIERGADLDATDDQGRKPLELAAGERRLLLERQFVFPKLANQQAVTVFIRLKREKDAAHRVQRVAEFESPPSIADVLRLHGRALLERSSTTGDPPQLIIYRSSNGEAAEELFRAPVRIDSDNVRLGELGEVAKWPESRWGDVIVFLLPSNAPVLTIGKPSSLIPQPLRRFIIQVGNRSRELVMEWEEQDGPTTSERRINVVNIAPRQQVEVIWNTLGPLPPWRFSQLVQEAIAAEPHADLANIKVQRTVGGEMREWAVNLQGENGSIRDLPARISDGDHIIIPLLPLADEKALASRRAGMFFAGPKRIFGERVFSWHEKDPTPRTLGDLILQSYLSSEMIVPDPDFSRVTIHRLKPDGGEEQIPLDYAQVIRAGAALDPDAARLLDVPLQWGDIVEIPPAETATPDWLGFTSQTKQFFDQALARFVKKVSGTRSDEVGLGPRFPQFSDSVTRRSVRDRTSDFTVQSLLGDDALRTREIARVRIRSGESVREFLPEELDGADALRPLLRHGDVVEIDQR